MDYLLLLENSMIFQKISLGSLGIDVLYLYSLVSN